MKGKLLKKLLAVSLSTACVGSAAVTATPLAFANGEGDVFTTLGAIGTLTGGWDSDVDMTDPDGDGIYEVTISNVAAGNYEFKVRSDDCWDLTWSVYDDYWETTSYPGGNNISVQLEVASDVTVLLDTRGGDYEMWPVSYKYTDKNGKEVTVFTGYDATLKNESYLDNYYMNSLRAGQECELKYYLDAKGGTRPYQYALYIYNKTKGWKQLKDYCDDYGWNELYFTPEVDGENTIRIKVKDAVGTVVNKDFTVNVKPEFENTSYIYDDVIDYGDSVGMSFSSYGSGEKQYAVYSRRAGTTEWKTERDFGTVSYYYVEPSTPGIYRVKVTAKNEAGRTSDKNLDFIATVTSSCDYNSVSADYIFFDNSKTKWSKVYAYWWDEDYNDIYDIARNYYYRDYPGVEMTKIGNTDIYQARIPFRADRIQFNNGMEASDERRTSEVVFNAFDNAGQVYVVDPDAEPVVTTDSDKTHYTYNEGSWQAYTGDFVSENIVTELMNDSWCSDPVDLGDDIEIAPRAYGGKGNKTFAIYYKKPNATAWTKLTDYTSENSYYYYKPEAEGVYTIRVKAKDGRGVVVNKDMECTVVKRPLENDSYISSYEDYDWDEEKYVVSLSGFSVRTNAYGGVGDKTCAVYYKKSGKTTWTMVSDYSDAYRIQVLLPEEGDYTIRVKAKDSEGTVVNKDLSVNAVKVPLSIDYLYYNSDYSYGSKILIDEPEHSGGVGNVTTTVYYKQTKQTKWTKAAADGFTPKALTTYDVKVVITDSIGDTAEQAFTINIIAPEIYNYSNVYPDEIDLGDSTYIEVDGYGGYGNKSYEIYYKLESESSYKLFDSSKGYEFTPDAVGTYDIRVKVKDELDSEKDKDLKLKVNTPVFKNLSYIYDDTVSLGRSVFIDFSSKNGQGEVQFAVYYKLKDKTTWIKACDYNKEDGYYLKLDTEGKYDVRVKAKDEAGKVVNKDLDLEVRLIPLENDSYVSYTGKWNGEDCSVADGCWVYSDYYGGVGKVLFSIYYKKSDKTAWTKVSDYNDDYSTRVLFPEEGSYTIRVKAKDEKGTVVNKDIDVKVSVFPLTVEVSQIYYGYYDDDNDDGIPYSFEATASGGIGKRQYAFYYKQKAQENWTKAADYSDKNTVTVYPKSEKTYQIKALVKDERGSTAESVMEFEVKAPELVNQSWIDDEQIELGDYTFVNCSAYGGWGKKQYVVYYKLEGDDEWTTLRDYGDSGYVSFNPDRIGTYDFKVTAKDKKGKTADKSLKLKVIAPVYANMSYLDSSSIGLGQPVSVYFRSKNGTGNVEYAAYYKLRSSTKWTLICDYSMIDCARFTPAAEGEYDLRVKAKDEDGRILNKDLAFTVSKREFTNDSTIDCESVSDSGEYNVYVGMSYDVNTDSSYGVGEKQYEVSYRKEEQTDWTVVSEYTNERYIPVVFPEEGRYVVRVNAKDEEGSVKERMLTVVASKRPLTITDVYYRRSGNAFNIYPTVKGGEGEKQFALYYKQKKQTNWTKASDYHVLGDNEALTFTPKALTVYDVKVLAKDADGTEAESYLEVDNQLEELENDSYTYDDEIFLGDEASIILRSDGGYGALRYTVYYKQESQTNWTKAYDKESDQYSSCYITPKAAKTYDVKVIVTDEKGRTAEKLLKINVKPNSFTNTSDIYYDVVDVGNRAAVYNSSRFGAGLVTYSVFYKLHEASSWTRICSDTTADTVFFVPKTAGLYDVRVKAKDETGKVVNKDLSIAAEEYKFRNSSYITNVSLRSDFYDYRATLSDGCSVCPTSYNGYGNVEYSVQVKKFGQTKWTVVSDYSDAQYVPLVFNSAGVYAVRVIAKDEKGRTATSDLSVEVVDAPLTIAYYYCDDSYYDNELHAYADVSAYGGSGKKQYAAYYKQATQTSWTRISDFTDVGEFNFSPKSYTTYNVKLIARDEAGNTAEKIIDLECEKSELINQSYLSSSEIDLGESVNIYCASYGGVKSKQYAVYYKREDQTKWNKLSDYSTETHFTLTPNVKASYTVRVKTKDSAGTVVNRDLKFKVIEPVFRNLSFVNDEQYLNEPVVVTCRSKGASGTVQYAVFYKKNSQTTWTKAADFSTNEKVSINNVGLGIYDLRVKAKDSTGAVVNRDFSFRMIYGTPRNTSMLESDVIRLQDSAKVLCSSKRGHGTVKYAVYYRRSEARNWILVSDYSTSDTVTFKPGAVGEYDVRVDAMDEDGSISNKYLTLTVKNADFVNSSLPVIVSDDGEVYSTDHFYNDEITVFFNSVGGTGTVEYAVFYLEDGETTWTKAVDYTSKKSAYFTPKFKRSSSKKIKLRIKARDSSNKVVNRDFDMYRYSGSYISK